MRRGAAKPLMRRGVYFGRGVPDCGRLDRWVWYVLDRDARQFPRVALTRAAVEILRQSLKHPMSPLDVPYV